MTEINLFWGLLAFAATVYSWLSVGPNADYWELRYRTRNWGQGDKRFTPGSIEE
jgi:hypothetical protein